jgi:hypothetical protein
MMQILTFPFRALFWLVVLPLRIAALVVRWLGPKGVLAVAGGAALGVVVAQRRGAGDDAREASYPDSFGGGDFAVATVVDDSIEIVDTPDGPVVALVEDTLEVVETADGEVVTETMVVTELDEAESAAVLEAIEAELETEAEDELEAEIDQALGVTGGELGVDVADDTDGDADV